MSNSIEKSINLGLGLLMYSRQKVEELVEELINKGELAKQDARQFAGELVKRGEEQREELKALIRGEVTKALEYLHMAKKEDLITKDEIREIIREQIQQTLREQGGFKNESPK